MAFVHLVARTCLGVPVFRDADLAWALWAVLKRATTTAVAACIMPNHLHLIVDTLDAERARAALAKRLAAFAGHAGFGRLWAPLPPAVPIPDGKHLLRQVRYVHLNPCRAELVADPLCWPWSTHRGVLGAELEPWVTAQRLSRAIGRTTRGFAPWFHGYVSSDPTTAVGGTPMLASAPSTEFARFPLETVFAAAAAATPHPAQRLLRRRLTVLLARDQGWRNTSVIARALGVTPRQVQRLQARPSASLLRVGRLFLADARLR